MESHKTLQAVSIFSFSTPCRPNLSSTSTPIVASNAVELQAWLSLLDKNLDRRQKGKPRYFLNLSDVLAKGGFAGPHDFFEFKAADLQELGLDWRAATLLLKYADEDSS